MQFQKFGSKFIVRLDRGEEVVGTLQKFCAEQKISSGTISGIGAVERTTVGFFDTKNKKYRARELPGGFELASLAGNISTQSGEVYLHLHANLADAEQRAFAGHLSAATVSATCEIVVEQIDGAVAREFDSEVGLNLLKFISEKIICSKKIVVVILLVAIVLAAGNYFLLQCLDRPSETPDGWLESSDSEL